MSVSFSSLCLSNHVLDFSSTSIGYRLFGTFADLNVMDTLRMGSFNQADFFRDHEVPGTNVTYSVLKTQYLETALFLKFSFKVNNY